MPIYEYRCPNNHVFELFHRMADPSPEACEVCGAGPLERVLYPVAVHFKGSGFYSTDYGRGNRKPAKDGESSSSGSEPAGGDKSAETKKPAEAQG